MSVLIDIFRHIRENWRMTQAHREAVLDIVREAGLARPRDLESWGMPGWYLGQLAREGLLEKVGRGLLRAG